MSAPENAAKGQLGEPLAGPAEPGQAPERANTHDKWGAKICVHGRVHRQCKECGGAAVCQHERRRSECGLCRPIGAVRVYIRGAKKRGYSWLLTDNQAVHILKQPCAYCGQSPCGGIDRRKNEYGYTVSNSVPCCSVCNFNKKTKSAKQFIEECHRVSKYCIDRETFMARNAELQKQLKEFEQWQSESTSVETAE